MIKLVNFTVVSVLCSVWDFMTSFPLALSSGGLTQLPLTPVKEGVKGLRGFYSCFYEYNHFDVEVKSTDRRYVNTSEFM